MKKKALVITLIVMFMLFGAYKIKEILASNDIVKIEALEIDKVSDTTTVNSYEYDSMSISSDVTFRNIDDFVTYKIALRNTSDKNYKLKVTEEYDSDSITYSSNFSDEQFVSQGQKEIYVTAKYTKSIEDIRQRVQSGKANIILELEDEDGKTTEENIIINNKDAPKTGDKISVYILMEIMALIVLIIFLKKDMKISKARKNGKHIKKLYSLLILCFVAIPTIAKASTARTVITINTKYELKDKLIVSYNVNGDVKQEIVKYNTKPQMNVDVSRDGYTFKGWYTSKTDGEKIPEDFVITDDTEIYAQFDLINYDITYELNGGQAQNPTQYTVEDEITLNNPEKEGYTFSGWTGSNGENLQTRVTIEKGSTGNKNYTANYSPNPNTKYTVIHKKMNIDGQDYTVEETEALYGATDTVVTPAVRNYQGFTAPQEKSLKITGDGNASVTYEYERNKYTLTLQNKDCIDIENTTPEGSYYYETTINAVAKNKTGYYFKGWNNGKIDKEITFTLVEDTILEPTYGANEYVINFDGNGGSGTMSSQTVVYDQQNKFSKNTFTKTGYSFSSWNTKPDGTGTSYTDEQIVTKVEDMTLYAQWTANNYNIVFNSNGGTGTMSKQTIAYDTTANLKPNSFTYENHIFKKWNTKSDGSGTDYEDEAEVTNLATSGNFNLYAIWEEQAVYNVSKGAKLLDARQLKTKVNTLGTNFSTITAFKKSSTAPGAGVSKVEIQTNNSAYKVYAWWDGTELYWYCEEDPSPMLNSNCRELFSGCSSLTDISGFADMDSSSVTNLQETFKNTKISSLESLKRWNTTNLNSMQGTFQNTPITSLDGLQNWKFDNLVTMNSAFVSCSNLSDISAVKKWDTSNVQKMSGVFQNCKLSSLEDIEDWNTGNVTEMIQIFENNPNLTSLEGISGWDVSNVKDLRQAFSKCTNVESLEPLRNWNTQSLTSLKTTFAQMKKINSLEPLNNWDVSNVTTFESCFDGDTSITSLSGLEDWDVSSATTMLAMFYGLSNMTDASAIAGWNVTNSMNFTKMFKNCNRATLPTFTNLPGSWDSNGSYIPTT